MDDETKESETHEPAPVTKETPVPTEAPVTKETPIVTQAEAEAAAAEQPPETTPEPPEAHEVEVSLGPFFTLGALLMVVGVLRRKPLALLAGLGAIWVDQRTAFGRRVKKRIRARAFR